MKKSLLLLVAGAITMSANAQYSKSSSLLLNQAANNSNIPYAKRITPPSRTGTIASRHSAARTTSITSCSYTETFPSTVLTTGGSGGAGDVWTTGTLGTSGAWHQTSVASSSGNNLGTLASSTASNGWMIFDSDSIRGTSTIEPSGYLQSPAINCMGLTTVGLSFQELFQGGAQDTCYIEVSTSSTFATFTSFPIDRNNLFTYERTDNPDSVLLDISSAAAGHPAVYIRFIYVAQMYWGFSWLLDDVCVGPLSSHDVGLFHQFVFESNASATPGAAQNSIFEMPLEFIDHTDSLSPAMELTNYAHAVEASVPLTANIYGPAGATSYSQTVTYSNLPSDAIDSIIQFNGYVPNVKGAYTCAFNAALPTDTDPANNIDTSTFYVSDTIWNDNYGQFLSDYAFYVYGSTASIGGTTPIQSYFGARFDVPPNVTGDTVSGFGVAFSGSSQPTNSGGSVMVQLYSRDPSTGIWAFQGSSVAKMLTTMNYSTSSSVVYAYFPTYTGYGPNGGGNFILAPNTTYAAVVQTNGLTKDLLIMATDVPAATYYTSYLGESYASSNDGGQDFGGTPATGSAIVPLVQMYFNNIRLQNEGVTNVTLDNSIGQAFPNPTNSDFTVPFTMGQDNKVTVTLTDVMGQVLNTQTVNAIGGQAAKAVFNTSDLATGMYIYTVQANGVNTTGRIVVSH